VLLVLLVLVLMLLMLLMLLVGVIAAANTHCWQNGARMRTVAVRCLCTREVERVWRRVTSMLTLRNAHDGLQVGSLRRRG
jgi:hypothetical protein